jgi:hypothetical protein
VLLLFCLPGHLRLLELELSVVHDSGDWRPRHRRDFDQVQALLDRRCQSRVDIHDSELCSISGDHADGADANLFVDSDPLGGVLNTLSLTEGKQKRGPS